ncbi:MAG: PEP-CTERM sorting domain-containing protein [Phycisphaerae bacterium]
MQPARTIPLILAVVSGALNATQVSGATAPMYICDSTNNLLTVDPATGELELVAGTFAQMTDIAFSPSGVLYGVTPTYLYEIDPDTGWNTLIGAHGFSSPVQGYGIDALTFDRSGNLYAAGNNILIRIDPATGQGTAVGALSGYRSAGDLAVTATDRLLLTTDSGDLVEVHRDGSGATLIGSLPYSDVFAMGGSLDGNVYGIRSTNDIILIDENTGRGTIIGELSGDMLHGRAWGGSFPDQFVPEPATLLLLVSGTIALLRRRTAPGKTRPRRLDSTRSAAV